MSARSVPTRSEIAPEHTFDTESIFAAEAEWEAEREAVEALIPDLAGWAGRLGHGPNVLAGYLDAAERALRRLGRPA